MCSLTQSQQSNERKRLLHMAECAHSFSHSSQTNASSYYTWLNVLTHSVTAVMLSVSYTVNAKVASFVLKTQRGLKLLCFSDKCQMVPDVRCQLPTAYTFTCCATYVRVCLLLPVCNELQIQCFWRITRHTLGN